MIREKVQASVVNKIEIRFSEMKILPFFFALSSLGGDGGLGVEFCG